jgi:hypothetical protein
MGCVLSTSVQTAYVINGVCMERSYHTFSTTLNPLIGEKREDEIHQTSQRQLPSLIISTTSFFPYPVFLKEREF